MIKQIKDEHEKSKITETILRSLPSWFGVEQALLDYVESVKTKPFFVYEDNKKAVAFLALAPHNPSTIEIHVMGVLEDYHRKGIGKALVTHVKTYAKNAQYQYLEVKTLAPTHPDKGYQKTRQFYERVGFHPVEVMEEIWGKENPCLIMIQKL